MAWTSPRTWVAGETVTETQFNAHIRDDLNYLNDSRVAYVQSTSPIGPTSGTTELDIITAGAYTPISSSRLIRIWFHCRGVASTGTSDLFIMRIKEGATILNESHYTPSRTAVAGMGSDFSALVPSPSASAHTYKATIQRSGAVGDNATVSATSTAPMFILVEDKGAA